MTNFRKAILTIALCFAPAIAGAQALDPSLLTKPATDAWPSYSGDYSGRRYSPLNQINQSNVKNLTLAWTTSVTLGTGGGSTVPTIVGGEGPGDITVNGGTVVRASILQINGYLYFSTPDNAWAADARTGEVLWHYFWKTKGGTHIGNRGLAMWGNQLYMETPDDYLVCLDARTGKEKWHKEIADFNEHYFSTMAPIVVGNHLIVGTGDDLDAPGYLQALDPETGDLQWRWYAVPQKAGDPGLDTWKSLEAARHGGGNVWIPGSYDPETHLYIFGTGNPTPAYTTGRRGEGDNLYTCSIVAVNVDTGKMAWYFQASPHDTHDWDAAQTPVLVDGNFGGKPRKMVLDASRNGYFFVLDRMTGEHLVTSKFSATANWAKGVDQRGQPVRDPEKDATFQGSLVSPSNNGGTNWPPPSYDPDTGLFYVQSTESYSMYYLLETDPRGATGLGGKDEEVLDGHD